MNLLWPAVITFCVGAFFTWFELRVSKYPTTGHFIAFIRPVLIYCTVYGAIATGGFLLSGSLIANGKLKIEGLGLESPYALYILAVVLGLSSKAIMQLNLYTVLIGSTPFPLGFQTFIQIFEPFLLRSILIKEDDEVRNFVEPFAAKYPITAGDKTKLDEVKQMIFGNIPKQLPDEERSAFKNDIEKDTQVHEAMEHFLRFLGRGTFLRVFK
jgi:hypothetical protein